MLRWLESHLMECEYFRDPKGLQILVIVTVSYGIISWARITQLPLSTQEYQ